MINIEKSKLENLKTLIEKNNKQLVNILNEIINTQIEKMIFDKKICLNNISEYKFEVIKVKSILENQKEIEMYLTWVKNSKIKESIFCYWCLIYEEELEKKKLLQKEESFINKVLISELTKKKYYQSVFLKIENNKLNIIEKGTEVDFIDLKKYIKEQEKITNNKEFQKNLEGLDEYVLLLGMKMNRSNEL